LLPDEAEEELHRRKNKAMEMLKPVKDNLAKLGIVRIFFFLAS
jgi:hypothetical protein